MKNRLLIGSSSKLTLLLELIRQSPATTVIDFDGSLARELDGFHFDPSDYKTPLSFNPLRNVKQKDKPKLVEDLVAVLNSLSTAGENTLSRLYASVILPVILTVLLDTPNTSLSDVLNFISDTTLQAKYLAKCKHPYVKQLWQTIQEWEPADRKRAYTFIQAQLSPILLSPVLSRTLLGEAFKFPPMFVVDLSAVGDQAARLLGTLFMARAKPPVFVHGFEHIATDYLASLFSAGGYTITVPFLSTLPPTVAQTVLGFEEKYIYRTSLEEAEQLKYFAGTLEARNIVDLAPGEFLPRQD